MADDRCDRESGWEPAPAPSDSRWRSRGAGLRGVDLGPWFQGNARDLPWRATRNPWAVLVSEIMLQQTQVARVVPRWKAFLDRFPTVADCAAAPVGEVIGLWHGLGYNRRAVNLHRTACAVVERFGGVLPDRLDDLLSLPGVGAYTARAVLVFAFERPEAVVDTNVARILARTEGRALARREAQELADKVVVAADPWTWNQALLDIGAGYCRPRRPECGWCPLASVCTWSRAGTPDPDPALRSAAVSRPQSRFEGSDRQGRGRLVAALRTGPVARSELAEVMGWPHDLGRARRVAGGLVADRLIVDDGDRYRLP